MIPWRTQPKTSMRGPSETRNNPLFLRGAAQAGTLRHIIEFSLTGVSRITIPEQDQESPLPQNEILLLMPG